VDVVKRIWSSPFGAAVTGGLIVGILGWLAIAAGWIDSKNDSDGVPLAQAPLVKPSANSSDSGGLTVHDIYQRTAPGVAFIQSQVQQQSSPADPFGGGQGTATGSGFVIDEQGHIVTNAHVVDGASQITVKLGDDQPTVDAKVVGRDPSSDLAVIQVDPNKVDLHPLPLDNSSNVQVGDPVVAIGNPFGLDRTATAGIVSALQREIDAPNGFTISDVIQTDAPINPGNSGGPLIDSAGKVVGVNSQIATAGGGGGSVGIGFAIPSNTAHSVIEQLLATGHVQHAFLGVTGADVDSQVADVLNLGVQQGALVQQVVPGGPAAKAGVKGGKAEVSVSGQRIAAGGDVITAVDGKPVSGMDEVAAAVNAKQPGDEIQLTLVRGSDHRDVTVTLGNRPKHASGGSGSTGPPGLP
jgi:S1-C subfamily serine protease